MTAADASWTQYAGTRVLVRGDRTQADALTGVAYTPNAVTLDMTGAVNTGNQNIISNSKQLSFSKQSLSITNRYWNSY
jgi:hypothetical protein